MNIYQEVSFVLAILVFFPLVWKIVTGRAKQNLATFILWGVLDLIAGVSILVQGGNYYLPLGYVLGAMAVCLAILKTGTFKWTKFETQVSFMVLLSIAAWAMSGPYWATIFSTVGVALATLPQVKDSWSHPESMPYAEYMVFTMANGLSILGGNAWTIEERFYPTTCFLLTFLLLISYLRKVKTTVEV